MAAEAQAWWRDVRSKGDRVAGGLSAPVLPHHRTYSSYPAVSSDVFNGVRRSCRAKDLMTRLGHVFGRQDSCFVTDAESLAAPRWRQVGLRPSHLCPVARHWQG
jgi:hypothetical protein